MFIRHLTATTPRLLLLETGIEGVAAYVKENMWAYYILALDSLVEIPGESKVGWYDQEFGETTEIS